MPSLTAKQRAIYLSEAGFSPQAVAGVLGVDLTDVKALMFEANPDVSLPGGTAVVPVLQTIVDIDYPRLVTLPTVPVEIVPNPGAGKIILPFSAAVQMSEEWSGFWSNIHADVDLSLQHSGGAGLLSKVRGPIEVGNVFSESGGAYLGIEQSIIVGSRTTQTATDATSMTGSLGLRANNQGNGNFTPDDVGGYPDAILRVTVLHAVTDLVPSVL